MLAVIAILILLMALVVPVLMKAIDRGQGSDEISRLHQIGLAANLYRDQADDWPENTRTLVQMRMIPEKLCKSPKDSVPEGWANRYLRSMSTTQQDYLRMVTRFPNTFLALGDVWIHMRQGMRRILSEQDNPGLFVSLVDSESMWPGEHPTGPFKGRYLRVLLDGSVVVRWHRVLQGKNKNGDSITGGSDQTWFFDPNQQWLDEFFRSLE